MRNLTSYGTFVEIDDGLDGLLHVSDMSWTKKIQNPSDMLDKGERVKAVAQSSSGFVYYVSRTGVTGERAELPKELLREAIEIMTTTRDNPGAAVAVGDQVIYGKYGGTDIEVNGEEVKVLCERSPANLPWKDLGVQIVVESTGVFRKREQCALHLEAGAKKVILTVPAKDEIDATIVLGVNHDELKREHRIVSNASCTTNCLAPVVKVMHEQIGIRHGCMTTIHDITNTQIIVDAPHKDLYRGRAAAVSMVPTSTGAAKAISLVLPHLEGRLEGLVLALGSHLPAWGIACWLAPPLRLVRYPEIFEREEPYLMVGEERP